MSFGERLAAWLAARGVRGAGRAGGLEVFEAVIGGAGRLSVRRDLLAPGSPVWLRAQIAPLAYEEAARAAGIAAMLERNLALVAHYGFGLQLSADGESICLALRGGPEPMGGEEFRRRFGAFLAQAEALRRVLAARGGAVEASGGVAMRRL